MKIYDLNALTHKVESVSFKKAKGKQSKPEVWIDLGQPGKFRAAYGSDHALYPLTREIKKGDVITVYLKKSQHAFIDLGMDNDVLQITRSGQVVYSMEIPKKVFMTITLSCPYLFYVATVLHFFTGLNPGVIQCSREFLIPPIYSIHASLRTKPVFNIAGSSITVTHLDCMFIERFGRYFIASRSSKCSGSSGLNPFFSYFMSQRNYFILLQD
jgi:hypothetical protein